MTDYRSTDGDRVVVERRGPGRTIGIVIGVLALVVVLLFASGFWSADVKKGSLPDVNVSAKGGSLPKVDLDSKEVVVGTKKTEVDVPVVGVKDNGEK
jgi:type 1 fimbria pilin